MNKKHPSEEDLDKVVEETLGIVSNMLGIPAERFTWSVARAIRALVCDFAIASNTLSNKIVVAARAVIEERENAEAAVEHWRLFDARFHEVIASVEVTVDGGSRKFTVWVVANLATEEVYCL